MLSYVLLLLQTLYQWKARHRLYLRQEISRQGCRQLSLWAGGVGRLCFFIYLTSWWYDFTFVGRRTTVSQVSDITVAVCTTWNINWMIFKGGRGEGKELVCFPGCVARRARVRLSCLWRGRVCPKETEIVWEKWVLLQKLENRQRNWIFRLDENLVETLLPFRKL